MDAIVTVLDEQTHQPTRRMMIRNDKVVGEILLDPRCPQQGHGELLMAMQEARDIETEHPLDPPLVDTGSVIVPATQQAAGEWIVMAGAVILCAIVVVGGIYCGWPLIKSFFS